nr:Putative multidrug export ATP-binding/permease protein SAV1866 [Klebsiella pneumoniae]
MCFRTTSFADTIANNIRLGAPDTPLEAVIAAARVAQAHDFISALPEGYNTRVGERGVFLSGGQRQRITIARALLQDRPIPVLDEATAFADPENEAALIKALAAAMRGRTVIMVAHRLSMVTQADVILLFSDGQLRKWGTIRNCWRRAACINGSGNTISRRSIGCRVEHRKRWWKMKDNNPADNPAWRVNWRQLISSVGSQARMLRRSMLALLLAAFMQGIAFACLYPIIDALLRGDAPQLLGYGLQRRRNCDAGATLVWPGFEYRGHLAQATHELRLRLGEQLRRVPLEKLQRGRAGEMNALLLGSVDENLNYVIAIANILLLTIVTPLTASLATLWIDWRLGLVMLLIFPLLVPFYYWRRPAMRRQMQTLGKRTSV